jgi:hypothetical protein
MKSQSFGVLGRSASASGRRRDQRRAKPRLAGLPRRHCSLTDQRGRW